MILRKCAKGAKSMQFQWENSRSTIKFKRILRGRGVLGRSWADTREDVACLLLEDVASAIALCTFSSVARMGANSASCKDKIPIVENAIVEEKTEIDWNWVNCYGI